MSILLLWWLLSLWNTELVPGTIWVLMMLWSHLILLKLTRDFYTGKYATQSSSEPEAFLPVLCHLHSSPFELVLLSPPHPGRVPFLLFCLTLCLAPSFAYAWQVPIYLLSESLHVVCPQNAAKCLWSVKSLEKQMHQWKLWACLHTLSSLPASVAAVHTLNWKQRPMPSFKVSSNGTQVCNTAISLMWAKYLWRGFSFG